MRLEDFLSVDDIELDLKSTSKNQVIEELATIMFKKGHVDKLEDLIDDILLRESLYTTGIGYKIALPHAKTSHISEPQVVFGISKEGIDYGSMDGQKAQLFFLICIPESGINLHLKVLAMLSRSLMHESFRNQLLAVENKDQAMELLKNVE